MGDDLEARLKSHARAFEGLTSLIPAKEYYGKDESITSTQWQKTKKQSREERQAAKRAKLDPASHKTAKDVMDENARKRKRELDAEESSDIDLDIEKERPFEGLKTALSKMKKQKIEKEHAITPSVEKDPAASQSEVLQAKPKARAEKRREKAERQKEKRRVKAERKKEKLAQKKQNQAGIKALQTEFSALGDQEEVQDASDHDDVDDTMEEHGDDDMHTLDVPGLVEEPASTVTPSSAHSNASSASEASAASSTSSIAPPASGETSEKKEKKENKPFKYDPKKHDEYQSRLAAKLESLRAARKADGPDGRPARNRAELIEARRKKEAERKAAKRANRQLAKEDEERLKAEEQLAHIRGGSGSPSLFPMRSSPDPEPNLAFGKVAWKDGQQLEGNLSGFLESRKRKGKSDAKTALEAAEKKRARLSALDEAKRKDIEEKDLWLTAKKRAQGEKVLDDPALLKKTVKRQEKEKAKSKQEWKERLTNVQKGKEMRQKKRETNLQKRREEKGQKGKGKGKGKKASKPGKKVKRPGFEGTFKAR